ncbi:MAG: penicillin-binding protein 1C [Elusimicrobia bacterium]|nr:penicillin-binding protein 1C [Elusimicrobiota bacterium]
MSHRIQAAFLGLLLVSTAAADSTRLLDRHGRLLQELSSGGRDVQYTVPLEDISPWAVLAVLAAEDRRFFEHGGMDLRAVLRAAWQNLRLGRVVSGGSTLTQQLARRQTGLPRSWSSKVREALAAVELERRLDKREILERYLNMVSFGNRAAGIEAASRLYLGKPARELSIAEAAYLCAIPRSPGTVNPYRNEGRLKRRQREILTSMEGLGWIGQDLYELALREPIRTIPPQRWFPAPHFADRVRRLAESSVPRPDSLKTSLDAGLQAAAEDALRSHLASLKGNHVSNGAVLVLDNWTREVLAWVGSADFFDQEAGQVDGVSARRQPGSSLKPFIYGLALSKGWRASDIIADLPIETPDRFRPRNYDNKFHGLVRLREALACSYNVAAVRLAQTLGAPAILSTLHGAGFDSLDRPPEHYGLALALGDGEVTLSELTNAYASIAAGGIWAPMRLLAGRQDPFAVTARRVFSPEVAYLLAKMLSDNTARVPAFGFYSPFNAPFPLAAKTGTTKDYRDNWAVGFTPEWTVGVWVGNFDGKPMARVSGISGAGPILRDVAFALWKRRGASEFPRPRGIRELEVCPLSGKLPGPRCPTVITELFDSKNPPREACGLHAALTAEKDRGLPEDPPAGLGPRVPYVAFPKAGDIFKIDRTFSLQAQQIRLRAARISGYREIRWKVDGREIGGDKDGAWWRLSPGRHRIRISVLGDSGWKDSPAVAIFVAG